MIKMMIKIYQNGMLVIEDRLVFSNIQTASCLLLEVKNDDSVNVLVAGKTYSLKSCQNFDLLDAVVEQEVYGIKVNVTMSTWVEKFTHINKSCRKNINSQTLKLQEKLSAKGKSSYGPQRV